MIALRSDFSQGLSNEWVAYDFGFGAFLDSTNGISTRLFSLADYSKTLRSLQNQNFLVGIGPLPGLSAFAEKHF
jgi:hypothetical protein